MQHRPQDGQPQPCQFLAKPFPLGITEPQRAGLLQEHGFRHGTVGRRMTQAGQQFRQSSLHTGSVTRPSTLRLPRGAPRTPPGRTTWHPTLFDGLMLHTAHPLADDTTERMETR
ncbi:hypothetical protein SAM40697_5912 [Streptomyces ambofaciens]|uniref:Transposase n=1 Tax=Streptomyces ambofaciens TaxID=1889 RepID=A0ABM6B7B2_STRAM|nr:hypothetical protein SAM40697_5912 [Streptomyces ambofaciens]